MAFLLSIESAMMAFVMELKIFGFSCRLEIIIISMINIVTRCIFLTSNMIFQCLRITISSGPWSSTAALPARCRPVWLASSGVAGELVAHASHPDLDPLFSSSAVEIRVGDPHVARLEKVRRLADWEPARSIVQPCWQRSDRLTDGRLNCGRCEKCVRTMLALLSLGKLRDCSAFVEDDVEPAWIRDVECDD